MLRTESVASFLQKKLNQFGENTDPAYSFKLFAEVGRGDPNGNDLIGMVYAKKGTPTKNKYYVNVEYPYLCKIMVPNSISNFDVIRVKAIIDDFIQENNGSEFDIDEGKGIFTFETSEAEQLRTEGGFGSCVPVGFSIKIKYTENREGQVKYYLGLCDTQFDNNSVNTRYFEATETKTAKQVQIEYWEEKIRSGCVYEEIDAPNLDSIDIVSQVYKNSQGYELFDLTNKNYAVVKVEKNGLPIKFYYYFVTNTRIGELNRVVFDLKLDTIQTYFFDENIEFSDCLIHKAHLNRWVDNGDGTVSFDGTVDSKLFEREDLQNVSKRLTVREKVSVNNFFDDPAINDWLDENISCWVYVFCNPYKRDYKFYGTESGLLHQTQVINPKHINSSSISPNTEDLFNGFSVLCYPIYKSSQKLRLQRSILLGSGERKTYIRYLSQSAFQTFLNQNDGASQIYAVKVSPLPPFGRGLEGGDSFDYNIGPSGEFTIIQNNQESSGMGFSWSVPFANGNIISEEYDYTRGTSALFEVVYQMPYVELTYHFIKNYFTFDKSLIIGVNKNAEFNPKLLSIDYKSLRVGDQSGEGYDFDLQKINKGDSLILKVVEPLVADYTKTFVTISNLNGVYINDIQYNFTGFVGQNDYSLAQATTKYQDMLANNKNFFVQNSINRAFNFAQGAMSTGLNVAQGNVFGAISSGVGTLMSPLADIINKDLTVDNMKSAPANITNAKGNALLNYSNSEFGIYVEEYDILPNEKEIINDYMNLFGFTYNNIDNIRKICNIRKYHNYIQAELDAISGIPMSNVARADMKQRFQNGVRFWNYDTIQYDLENYEKWLEN